MMSVKNFEITSKRQELGRKGFGKKREMEEGKKIQGEQKMEDLVALSITISNYYYKI